MRLPSRSTAAFAAAVALATAAAGIAPAVATSSAPTASKWKTKTLAKHLNSPAGITLDGRGNVVIAPNGQGDPATGASKVAKYYTAGSDKGDLKKFGPKRSAIGIVHSPTGGYWSLGVKGVLFWQASLTAKPHKVKQLKTFAKNHPDPHNQGDGPATESNPYGLGVLPDGKALVTDAAANSLLKVTPAGKVTLVARFAPSNVKTDKVPADALPPGSPPLPPTLLAEAVPTSIAVSAGGTIYVGELKGFPFRPGSSRIWKISSGTTGAVCSANPDIKRKKCSVAHKNLTSVASIALNPGGGMVVLEFAKGGINEFEAGCFGPAGCPDAVVVKFGGGKRSVIAKGKFSAPGTIVATARNTFYVSDRVFTPKGGRLSKLTLS